MTISVVRIERVERPAYTDVFWSGGVVIEERPAAVEAFYEIEILAEGRRHTFEAGIRRAPRDALQLDWSDSLQDFLAEHECSEDDHTALGNALVDAHSGGFGSLPLHLGESSA